MMKARNNLITKFGKIFLVICTLFSQLSFSLEAFAEEVLNDEVGEVENNNGGNNNTLEKKNDNENTKNLNNNNNNNNLDENNSNNADNDNTNNLNDDEEDVTIDYDVDSIIEDILKVREDDEEESAFDVRDASYLSYYVSNGEWPVEKEFADELVFETDSNDSVLVGDTFELKLLVSGFKEEYINGIQGIVKYDDSLLKLESIDVLNVIKGNWNEEGKFVYLFEDYRNNEDEDEVLMTLTFTALKDGDATVYVDDIIATMDGNDVKLVDDNNSIFANVVISPAGIGGDEEDVVEETNNDTVVNNDTTANDTAPVVVNTSNTINISKATYVVLSSNNYISSLKIDGYEIDFDKFTYEYNINVGSKVKSLKLDVVLDSNFSSYVVRGNENFKDGKNVVEIVVTAENGNERIYSINVNKKKASVVDKEESKDNDSSASRVVIIILIVLVIIGLIYVIFKDDEEDVVVTKSEGKKNNTSKKK